MSDRPNNDLVTPISRMGDFLPLCATNSFRYAFLHIECAILCPDDVLSYRVGDFLDGAGYD